LVEATTTTTNSTTAITAAAAARPVVRDIDPDAFIERRKDARAVVRAELDIDASPVADADDDEAARRRRILEADEALAHRLAAEDERELRRQRQLEEELNVRMLEAERLEQEKQQLAKQVRCVLVVRDRRSHAT
jgi:hypothetical protein